MKDERIHVGVVEFSDRRHYQLQWRDPRSRRKKTKSSGILITNNKRDRAEAERLAGILEDELNSGRYRPPAKMTWEEFRERHEAEFQATTSPRSNKIFAVAFDFVETMIRPERIRDVTTETISRFAVKLQEGGRSPATVSIYCRALRSALNWGKEMGFIHEVPKFRIPKGGQKMKGRPLCLEEHERMLLAVPHVIPEGKVEPFKRFLDALWASGLRLSECLNLSWDSSAEVSVVIQPGYHPALKFQAAGQKSRRAEIVPIPPELAEILLRTPEEERSGPVFSIGVKADRAGALITTIAKKAGVYVDGEGVRPAGAHDYRRAFATRWAKRVMPAVLQRLMRHKDIQTTLTYYISQNVEDIATDLWAIHAESNKTGNSVQKMAEFPVI